MRILAKAARWFGYTIVMLLILTMVSFAWSIWSRDQQLEWQVKHPTIGTDQSHLKPYFCQLDGITQYEWAEGLIHSDNGFRPYRKGISGFLKLNPECRKQIETKDDLILVEDNKFDHGFHSQLLAQEPHIWYATTLPIGIRLLPKYRGTFYYEKKNGVLRFIVVYAPD